MNKVILLEQHIKKQESERRLRIFDAENARVQLIYQKNIKSILKLQIYSENLLVRRKHILNF